MSLNALLPLFIYVPMVCLTVAGVICPQFGSKDSAKNRFSEEKENKLSFLSVRFLFKSMKKQNKSPKSFIFFVEMQPISVIFSPPLTDVSNYLDAIV